MKIKEDFKVIFQRDPAARAGFTGNLEVILSYSGLHALFSHRICHFLFTKFNLRLIPRLISQLAKFFTGIEIHPGADIEEGFFIDHGMGVVIGETTIIKKNVTIYQGVTLGGTGKDTGKRHPTLEENVVVGAGAKVLGNIVIGKNTNIGAGSVVIKTVPPNSTVVGVPGVVVKQEGKRIRGIQLDHTNLPDPIAEKLSQIQKEIDLIEETIHLYRKKENDKKI